MASTVFWAIWVWMLTIVSGVSFYIIERKVSQLKRVGIFANKKFMVIYFSIFLTSSVLDTMSVILLFIKDTSGDELLMSVCYTVNGCRNFIVAETLLGVQSILFLALHLLIFGVALKYSKLRHESGLMDRLAR